MKTLKNQNNNELIKEARYCELIKDNFNLTLEDAVAVYNVIKSEIDKESMENFIIDDMEIHKSLEKAFESAFMGELLYGSREEFCSLNIEKFMLGKSLGEILLEYFNSYRKVRDGLYIISSCHTLSSKK